MKNIRLFLQTVLFLVIVASAITFVPKIGQVLEGKPFEAGELQAPAIEHGHGEGHGEEHGEEQGEAHGDAHSDATTGHGDAVAVEAEAAPAMEAEAAPAMEAEAATAMEADQAVVEETVAEAVTEEVVAEEVVTEEVEAVTEAAAEAEAAVQETTEQVAEAPAYPADLVIQPLDPAKATQAPVAFSHAKHDATELLAGNCAFCHHKGDNVSCTSAGCHTDTSTKKLTGAAENVSFEAAFHLKGDKSCVGCHRTLKAGPTGCKDCHPK